MWRAKPSTKSYWLRCASSAITTMLRRSERTGCRSPFSSGKNFWIVVNTTPPEATASLARRSVRSAAWTGGWRSRSRQRAKVPKSWSSRSLRSVSTTMGGLGQAGRGVVAASDRAPGLEPLSAGAERADAGLHAVRDDQRDVGREERGNLRLVGLELLEGGPDRGVLVGRVLQLDHRQRQTVHEEDDVRAAGVLPLGDGELVDRQPVVVVWLVEVDRPRLRTGDRAIIAAVLDCDAIGEHPGQGAIAVD